MRQLSNEQRLFAIVLGLTILAGLALWWSAAQNGSWYEQALIYAHEQQRHFTREFGTGISRLSKSDDLAPLLSLIGLGFLYGVFHAVGPGHGKAIITAYAVTHESQLRRTAVLAFASAMVQGVTAILAVGGIALLVEGSMRRAALSVDNYLEPASYAAVALVGLYLALLGIRRFYRLYAARLRNRAAHGHHHDHTHSHDHVHDHAHGADADACCGHSHGPSAEDVARATNPWRAAMVALSVGIRPCSGAVLVLVLTYSVGLFASGVAAVVAMSVGTGATVAAIALTAQSAKWPLARLTEKAGLPVAPISAGTALLGGGVIFALGGGLLYGALSAPAHPLF